MRAILIAVVILAVFHVIIGVLSICLGVTASIQADVWMAHSVSPIWSGAFFAITGILGFACAKKRTAYMIMCFTAFSIVSLVTAVVSIQLLRLGLVNQTTDGNTYQKEEKDSLIIAALGVAGVEGLICLISAFASCRLARKAKKDMERKRDGTFHVQVLGEKDIIVVSTNGTSKNGKSLTQKEKEAESENNNKCAVYSVEKGYHNPYILSHNQDEEEDNPSNLLSSLSPVHEDHIQILVNSTTADAGDVTAADSTVTTTTTTTAAAVFAETAVINSTDVENNSTNPFNSGVTYHWKSKHKMDLIRNSKRKTNNNKESNRSVVDGDILGASGGHTDSVNTPGQSVRVEIDEHTDDEDCNVLTRNMFNLKGNSNNDDSQVLSDLEITTP